MNKLISLVVALFAVCQMFGRPIHVGQGHTYTRLTEAVSQAIGGDSIWVHGGYYAEGNIVIDKPIALIGIGYPVIDGKKEVEVFTIKSSNVLIKGFKIQNTGQMSTIDLAGIKVLASNHIQVVENVLLNCNFAIYLSNTKNCKVIRNQIYGTPGEEQNTGNGIHLWKCDSSEVAENYATGQRDGIYFEFVTNSEIKNNLSEKNIRYGLHFMFSHNDYYANNTFRNNGAGVAVMYSRKVNMANNHFERNWGSSAYGILLKDISDSHIHNNLFEFNSAGIYLEGASRIVIEENTFNSNGWALRVQASCDANEIHRNNFYGNTFDVSTNGTLVLNNFSGNYWDKYEGYDLNRDGVGDIPFRPVSLYAVVVERMPFGLLLIRSFMVSLLDKAEKIMPSLTPENLKDNQPQTQPFSLR